jgi:hypothetical protein
MWKVIDTFEDFLNYWEDACSKNPMKQIELWKNSYMAKYPELLEIQIKNYENQGIDWREIAEKKVFPKIEKNLPLMIEARENILRVCGSVYKKASQKLGTVDIIFLIYVGIGCGAGWATRYMKKPACLLGLENIAELRWHSEKHVRGLLAHELSHLYHMVWRGEWENFEQAQQDPLFQLYIEGFAQRGEHIILESETWHEIEDEDWLNWCKENKSWLAKEYLRRINEGLPVNDFFGSWLEIKGKKQTGYYLGYEFIRWLEKKYDLKKIAILSPEEIREEGIRYLKSIPMVL